MLSRILLSAIIGAGCLLVIGTHAASASGIELEAAIQSADIDAVQSAANDARSSRAEHALASAALSYWQRQDDRAAPALARATHDRELTDGERRSAWIMLAGLRFRQGRYADVVAALDAALPGETDDSVRADLQQTRAFAAGLVGVPQMGVEVGGPGTVFLTRDVTSHIRATVTVNGGTLDAIVDTGSAVSTIAEGDAKRLGLRILQPTVSVGTATAAAVKTGLAVADTISVGAAKFRNVVFLLLPDAALTFAGGKYLIHGIIGLPVLLELGRLEFRTGTLPESLHYSRTKARPSSASNLTLDGDQAFAFVHVGAAGRRLRMFIDNGAPTTHLNGRFKSTFPAIVSQAIPQSATITGGGGSETQADALLLRSVTLHIDEAPVPLSDIQIVDDHHPDRDGDIGLDALAGGGGYVLDFDAMRLEVVPRG